MVNDSARSHPLVIVGSGAAGLMAAATAATFTTPLLLTDRGLGTSNSAVAQGGLQLPEADEKSLEAFTTDIITSARTALDPDRLRSFVEGVRPTVETLQSWGLELDVTPDGELRRKIAGGLSAPRIVTAGDQIGPALLKVLRARVVEADVEIRTRTQVLDIEPTPVGLRVWLRDRDPIDAKTVIAATGGLGFAQARRDHQTTTNPTNANEVLTEALRRRALAQTDPGLFQFQPFGLVTDSDNHQGHCVPESVVGHSVRLLDRHGRELCAPGADRLVVATAMFAGAAAGDAVRAPDGSKGFWLTLGDVAPSVVEQEYPRLHRLLEAADLVGQDVLVFPFLHYQLGGFDIGPDCSTAVPGLYLAGEMTGGLHGRNRLMGNGITDSVVHGRRAALAAASHLGLSRS